MRQIILGENNSVFNTFISEIRDRNIQKDPMRFRRNLERIGEIFAYEISRTFHYETKAVETPLGIADCSLFSDSLVLATILRAGLPLHQGLLNYFDRAQNAFVSSYRKYSKDNSFTIRVEYSSSPSLEGKTLILADTMLATGASLVETYKHLITKGTPVHTHLVCAISSQYGVDYVKKSIAGDDVTLWLGAIDEEMTSRSYIVPGLGDAGDLAFGSKFD